MTKAMPLSSDSISLVFPNQLYENHPAIKDGQVVLLFEDPLFFGTDPHWPLRIHKHRLILHRVSMKAYGGVLVANGHRVEYHEFHEFESTNEFLVQLKERGVRNISLCDPVDDILRRRLARAEDDLGLDIESIDSPNFLSSRAEICSYFQGSKKPMMANFYASERKKRGILLDSQGKPLGGKWSLDAENRKKLPKGIEVPPVPSIPAPTQELSEAMSFVETHFPDNPGTSSLFSYPSTRREALDWLETFLSERFLLFGDYEDALSTKHRVLWHSVLTAPLNIGLLCPQEIVDRALAFAEENAIPLNSLEGFIRQIIGWREFMRGMYEHHGVSSRNSNFWENTRPMPQAFYDGTTGLPPFDDAVKRLNDHAYCHHIERLMILGNLMLLCRVDPTDVYRWFMELFIDAYDWVMVPNVYGMSQFADGGFFTTKPYLCGSNYLRKMSDYPAGDWCATWDGLYWTFIDDHRDFFLGNHRLAMMARQLDRMDPAKLATHRGQAQDFWDRLW